MGRVMGKGVRNVYDIPQDIIVQIIGKGMLFNRESSPIQLEVSCGPNIEFDKTGAVTVDTAEDSEKSEDVTYVNNVHLGIDGRKLMLTKDVTDYRVKRNKHGMLVDITFVRSRQEREEVIITDAGYTASLVKPVRSSEPNAPNFYRK